MKNTPEGRKNRLLLLFISDLEGKVADNLHSEKQKENNDLKTWG